MMSRKSAKWENSIFLFIDIGAMRSTLICFLWEFLISESIRSEADGALEIWIAPRIDWFSEIVKWGRTE